MQGFLPLLLLLCALPLSGQTLDPPDPLGNVTFFEPVLFAKEDPLKGLPYADYNQVLRGRTTDALGCEHIVVKPHRFETLPFLIYWTINNHRAGLWHRQLGQLLKSEYSLIRVVSDSTYTAFKNDRSYLYHVDGRVLAGPYFIMEVFGNPPRFLIARIYGSPNSKGTHLVQLDLEGRFIQDLHDDIRQLTADRYVMRRTRRNTITRQYEQHYALFDDYLKPVTDFIFDAKINSRFQASARSITQLLNSKPPAGYGPWVGYMRRGPDKTVILIDAAGKMYEVKPD
ncbi:MAG: hypothetical protein IT261_00875 [Saprospiraceae bacterium]|nr:hypothetical protein [Saprospiraceae bacterium]